MNIIGFDTLNFRLNILLQYNSENQLGINLHQICIKFLNKNVSVTNIVVTSLGDAKYRPNFSGLYIQ